MIAIHPLDYPNLTWKWRIFHEGVFIGYINANAAEMVKAQADVSMTIDFKHLAVDIL